jgi:hypothetical protein
MRSEPRHLGCYEKIDGREHHTPGLCHFNKEQTPLAVYSTPTRGFTAALSVFGGTPPPKPLNCKSFSKSLGAPSRLSTWPKTKPGLRFGATSARIRPVWTHHIGGTPLHSCTSIRLALSDIIKTSRCYRSQIVTFRCRHFTVSFREQKTLLTHSKQGMKILFFRYFTCLPPSYPNYLRDVAQWLPWIVQG